MAKTALILLACGAEELETIAVVDILVRAKVIPRVTQADFARSRLSSLALVVPA